jgi:hypothetical protein
MLLVVDEVIEMAQYGGGHSRGLSARLKPANGE